MFYIEETENLRIISYDTIDDVTEQPPGTENNERDHQERVHQGRQKDWFGNGVMVYADAIKFSKSNWVKGAQKAIKLAQDIPLMPIAGLRRKMVYGSDGDSIDMQKVYAGNLDKAWSKRAKRNSKRAKVLDLNVRIGANCNTSSAALFWQGAVTLAVAETLELNGYSVGINAYSTVVGVCRNDGQKITVTSYIVKRHSEPLIVADLATKICFAGYFRAVVFMAYRAIKQDTTKGLGVPHALAMPGAEDGAISIHEFVNNEKEAIAEVHRILSLYSQEAAV